MALKKKKWSFEKQKLTSTSIWKVKNHKKMLSSLWEEQQAGWPTDHKFQAN